MIRPHRHQRDGKDRQQICNGQPVISPVKCVRLLERVLQSLRHFASSCLISTRLQHRSGGAETPQCMLTASVTFPFPFLFHLNPKATAKILDIVKLARGHTHIFSLLISSVHHISYFVLQSYFCRSGALQQSLG